MSNCPPRRIKARQLSALWKKGQDNRVSDRLQQKLYTINNRLRRWKHQQSQLMPLFVGNDLDDQWCEVSDESDESEVQSTLKNILGLPSDLDSDTREIVCSEALITAEVALRRAEASEALEDVRSCVRALANLGHNRAVHVRGQGMNTREPD